MRFHTLLTAAFASLVIASASLADTTAAPTPETPETSIKDIPPATDEQKEAMRESINIAAIEGFKIGMDNRELARKDPDALLRKVFEAQAIITDQILNGKLKDQLPAFYISETQKSIKLFTDFCEKTKDVKNLAQSPEMQTFMVTAQKANLPFDAYLKREIGKTSQEIAFETTNRINGISVKIHSNPDDYPTVKAIRNDMEKAGTGEEIADLQKVLRKEILRLTLEELVNAKD